MIKKPISFDTLKDVYESNFPIYVHKAYYNLWKDNPNNDEELNRFMSKFLATDDIEKCFLEIFEGKLEICLSQMNKVNSGISKYRNAFGEAKMEISKAQLIPGLFRFSLERASPFLEKFDKLLQRLFESDLMNRMMGMKIEKKTPTVYDKLIGDTSLLLILLNILICGSALSFAAFMIELLSRWKTLKALIKNV